MTLDQNVQKEEVDLGRRNLLINGGLATLGLILFGSKALSGQEKPRPFSYDTSYGTFYNFDNAVSRYWDLKEAFTEQNLHIIKLDDKLGERYRVITLGGHGKAFAEEVAEAKKAQLANFFKRKAHSKEELSRRVGDVAPLLMAKGAFDITPEKPSGNNKIIIQEEELAKYYVNFSCSTDKEHSDLDRRLLRKLGFNETSVIEERVNGKIFYKTKIGGYESQEEAVRVAEEVLNHRELVDLLGFPEINVVKAKYKDGVLVTDWSDSMLVRHEVKAEKSNAKIKEKGKRRVATSQLRCPEEIDKLIELTVSEWNKKNSSSGYSIDPELVKAMVWKESNYNPNKPGYKLEHIGNHKFRYQRDANGERILTAYGLLQVTRDAANEMGFSFDEVKNDSLANLRCGVSYFGKYYKRYSGDVKRSLGAYNAGPSRAENNTHTKYAETRVYIADITEQHSMLKAGMSR